MYGCKKTKQNNNKITLVRKSHKKMSNHILTKKLHNRNDANFEIS